MQPIKRSNRYRLKTGLQQGLMESCPNKGCFIRRHFWKEVARECRSQYNAGMAWLRKAQSPHGFNSRNTFGNARSRSR